MSDTIRFCSSFNIPDIVEIKFFSAFRQWNELLYIRLNKTKLRGSRPPIPTERPPLVGEVIANFCAWSAQRIPTAVNLDFLDRSRYFFIHVAPQLSSRG
jgi:hypothetical protein